MIETLLILTALLEINPLLQAIKAIRQKTVEDISVSTYMIILLIGGIWLFYGITISSIPLIVSNVIKLLTSLSVIIVYFIFKR